METIEQKSASVKKKLYCNVNKNALVLLLRQLKQFGSNTTRIAYEYTMVLLQICGVNRNTYWRLGITYVI